MPCTFGIYDVDETDVLAFLTTLVGVEVTHAAVLARQFVPNATTLAAVLNCPNNQEKILSVFWPVMAATLSTLRFCHDHGLAGLLIDPNHVLLTRSGRIYLTGNRMLVAGGPALADLKNCLRLMATIEIAALGGRYQALEEITEEALGDVML